MPANNWLQGRHALITGGGTGIGAAAATHLHAAGASISVLGRRMEPLERTASIVSGAADRSAMLPTAKKSPAPSTKRGPPMAQSHS